MEDIHAARKALRRYGRLRSTLSAPGSPLTRLGAAQAPRGSRRVGLEDGIAEMLDLEKALLRLEPVERELLVLVHVMQLSQGEAAALLGISLRSVNRRVQSALEEYARQLEP